MLLPSETSLEEIANLVEEGILEKHHTATVQGYVLKKEPFPVFAYKGHFGVGFVVKSPCYFSTRFSYGTYYILTEKGRQLYDFKHVSAKSKN